MAGTDGKLTDEEQAKLSEWWKTRWKGPVTCPVCKTDRWQTNPYLLNFQRFASASDTVYPHVHVQCLNCSYSLFFNAVDMGLLPTEGPKIV